VTALATDADIGVASNAIAATAKLGKALSADNAGARARASAAMCKAFGDARPYARANALLGLGVLAARCDGGQAERTLLAKDPSEIVRQAAARLLRGPSPEVRPSKEDARALSRCLSEDKSGAVASACRAAPTAPGAPQSVVVFVVPDGRSTPVPLAPYSLKLADGSIRSGVADRRGAIFEAAAPSGELRLVVPAPLAR
jgi:hypothetical protein